MATPVWPIELPQRFRVDGYSEKLSDGRIISKTSAGPGKARRRFSAAVTPVTGAMRLDYAGKSRFERFWREDTRGGVLAFIMPDQTHDGMPLLTESGIPIVDQLGNPILTTATWLVMFAQEAPTLAPYGVQWLASFTLNVLP